MISPYRDGTTTLTESKLKDFLKNAGDGQNEEDENN